MSLSVLVAGLAVAGTTAAFESAPRDSRIDAVWIDMVGCASDPRDVERTVDETLRPLRVDVRWKEARPSDPTDLRELRVVLTTPTRWARDLRVLGAIIPASSTPTVWVEYENVLKTLGLAPELRDPSDRDRLALALARIISHELVHVLAPEYGHDGSGLLAPWLDGSGLVEPEMRWSPTLVRWFRQRRKRARPRKTPASRRDEGATSPRAASGRARISRSGSMGSLTCPVAAQGIGWPSRMKRPSDRSTPHHQ